MYTCPHLYKSLRPFIDRDPWSKCHLHPSVQFHLETPIQAIQKSSNPVDARMLIKCQKPMRRTQQSCEFSGLCKTPYPPGSNDEGTNAATLGSGRGDFGDDPRTFAFLH